jgi:hypothetical protein
MHACTRWYTGERSCFPPCHFYLQEELESSFRKRDVRILETVVLKDLPHAIRRKQIGSLRIPKGLEELARNPLKDVHTSKRG